MEKLSSDPRDWDNAKTRTKRRTKVVAKFGTETRNRHSFKVLKKDAEFAIAQAIKAVDEMKKVCNNKHLYDAIISLSSSIKSVKNVTYS